MKKMMLPLLFAPLFIILGCAPQAALDNPKSGSSVIMAAPPAASPSPIPSPEPSPLPSPMPKPIPSPLPSPEPSPEPQQHETIDPSKPIIALTFDDGPSLVTPLILDVLERHGARATFFTVGNLVYEHKETVLRAIAMGSEVAGHSWDHSNLTRLNREQLKQQITCTSDIVYSVTGSAPAFFRPPYGAFNDTLLNVAGELGYAVINWTIDPFDWKYQDAGHIYDFIMRNVHDGAIILCHDVYDTTAEAMERLIPDLISQGYQLVTVSELFYHNHGGIFTAGKVYNH
jgi:peptidoglycan/xylan/chitin deacetylase (PgdA/CDA1 family)